MEILEKALKIGNEKTFTVRFYEDPIEYEEKELTYIQLGMYLMTKTSDIKRIDIIPNQNIITDVP